MSEQRTRGGETMSINMNPLEQPLPVPEQQTLFALEEMTVITTRSIGKIKEDIKVATQMLKDAYLNNSVYKGKFDTAVEVKKELVIVQNDITQGAPDLIGVKKRLEELHAELKEKKESVSEYALEVNRIGGKNEIEIDGEVYEIVRSAKLVKKRSM